MHRERPLIESHTGSRLLQSTMSLAVTMPVLAPVAVLADAEQLLRHEAVG